MSRADAFDAFFVHTRDQLLLETYAISGDLSASRGAVRDAYAVAWQHWSRVGGLTEREGWLRTHAYGGAARRHSAKVWHRHRQLDEGGRATLEALASLTRVQRKVLVLSHLAPVTTEQLIRTLGRPGRSSSASWLRPPPRSPPPATSMSPRWAPASKSSGRWWPGCAGPSRVSYAATAPAAGTP